MIDYMVDYMIYPAGALPAGEPPAGAPSQAEVGAKAKAPKKKKKKEKAGGGGGAPETKGDEGPILISNKPTLKRY